jgi:hypothetical protein
VCEEWLKLRPLPFLRRCSLVEEMSVSITLLRFFSFAGLREFVFSYFLAGN